MTAHARRCLLNWQGDLRSACDPARAMTWLAVRGECTEVRRFSVRQQAASRIDAIVERFEVRKPRVTLGQMSAMYFIPPEKEGLARELGHEFWLPSKRAYSIFVYAYAALFGVPNFTAEAVRRQSDRFSRQRLTQTIRSTSGFVLDGFGYDRRWDRPREVLYSPSIVIRSVHGPGPSKARISNAAMAYFGYQLIRAAELLAPASGSQGFEDRCRVHYDFVGDFFRLAGYPFSADRQAMAQFSHEVDECLAGGRFSAYWHNLLIAQDQLELGITPASIEAFLPERTARFFSRYLEREGVYGAAGD